MHKLLTGNIEMCNYCFAVVVPYYFGLGNYSFAWEIALTNPEFINVATLVELTKEFATSGMIDPTRNMLNHRVFVYHGANDTGVYPGHTTLIYDSFLLSFISETRIQTFV